MKQHKLDGHAPRGWAPLLDEVQLAFFYEGMNDPIVPRDTLAFSGPCGRGTWHETPKGHDLLTVSLPWSVHQRSVVFLNLGNVQDSISL